MFFRLDAADVPGLYSIDGYQDMSRMAAAEQYPPRTIFSIGVIVV